ncbi:vascular cell adhesion protein 1-like isoform X2 [Paramormyrops kingsleyae]|uniref:vascular cell adhesion protein 1-like isoform X2 n=1 Tax=Paramormyrops kingsleyae TaxID=1676925 RepID=UPI003B970DF2
MKVKGSISSFLKMGVLSWDHFLLILFVGGQQLCDSGCTAADGCLELHPPRVVVRHGDPVSVNCTVSTDHSGMGWNAPVDEVPKTRGVQFLTWRVESLRIWELRPLCYANRPGKPLCIERLSVTVYKPPDSVSVSSVNSDSMVEGSQYQLKCEIQNIAPVHSLTAKWYKGDTLVHEDRDCVTEDGKCDSEKEPMSVASTLLITPSRADDGAEYSCGAELDLGPEGPQPPLAVKSTPLRVTVHYKPTINPIDTLLYVRRGHSAVLNCSAKGNPPPDIVWIFNGQRLPTQDGIYTISERDDEGNYTCSASNYVGIHEKRVRVIFTAAADGCLELHPPRVVVRHGDPVSVNCTVSTDHSAMGWAAPVDDVPITPGVQFLTWRVESLRIWDLRPLCYANRPGKAQCKERLSVTVYKPPDSVSFSSMNSADSMVEGSQYHLKCEIQNIAPVHSLTVKWYKGETLVHEDRDYVIEDRKSDREKAPVSVASTILITANRTTNRTDDKIQYICEAELDLGPEGPQPPLAVKSTPLRVAVHYKPTITPIVTELHVIRGKSDVLNCSAKGNPPPDIVWIFNGRRLPTQDGIYTISETDDEGKYTCRANNYVGIHEKTLRVIFTDPKQTWILPVVVTLAVVAVLLFICCIYFWKRNRPRARLLAEVCFSIAGRN